MSPQEAKILRGREYNAAKPDASENLKKGNKSPSGQNVRPGKPKALTSRELAKKHGVNEKTIRRDAVRAELHDAVQEADPKAAEAIASMPDKDVAEISKVTKEAT
ncbi:hypothetical protein [Rhodopirellula baltica]